MSGPAMKVTATIEASGSKLTVADLRAFVDATDTLPEETVITANAGDSQKDGPWWCLIARFDPTTSRVHHTTGRWFGGPAECPHAWDSPS